MATAKYRQYFNDMFEANREKFLRFKLLHEDFANNQEKFKTAFDAEGKEILAIIKLWEERLCGKMERGGKGVFSSSLSDKFWQEIRKYYPLIDQVGITVTYIK